MKVCKKVVYYLISVSFMKHIEEVLAPINCWPLWNDEIVASFAIVGVSCDSCLKSNFHGRRYKCLICYDYDLCADCYEEGVTSTRHLVDHPMQCILTRSDVELYFGGEMLNTEQPQSFTCPFCKKMGFSDATLLEHVSTEHTETSLEVVCPLCAGHPGGEPNLVTDDFAGHLSIEHRTGPRELISFLISFSNTQDLTNYRK